MQNWQKNGAMYEDTLIVNFRGSSVATDLLANVILQGLRSLDVGVFIVHTGNCIYLNVDVPISWCNRKLSNPVLAFDLYHNSHVVTTTTHKADRGTVTEAIWSYFTSICPFICA